MKQLSLKNIIKAFFSLGSFIYAMCIFGFRRAKITQEKSLLIIKIDAIGDYILFRNFLKSIRESNTFASHKITLLANKRVRELAEFLDSGYVDEFIFIDRARILQKPKYLINLIKSLRGRFSDVIYASYSRDAAGDILVKFSGAKNRVGMRGDTNNLTGFEKIITDTSYSSLIEIPKNISFEFDKNKYFVQTILNEDISLDGPEIDREKLFEVASIVKQDKYVVLFPGKQETHRRWPAAKFASIGQYIHEKYGLDIVIAGSKSDFDAIEELKKNINCRYFDVSVKTTLPQLARLIAWSSLLISNDTSAVHFSAALGTPSIILSQFGHYGRFVPYPPAYLRAETVCITPDCFADLSFEEKICKFKNGSKIKIDLISIDRVREAVDKILDKSSS